MWVCFVVNQLGAGAGAFSWMNKTKTAALKSAAPRVFVAQQRGHRNPKHARATVTQRTAVPGGCPTSRQPRIRQTLGPGQASTAVCRLQQLRNDARFSVTQSQA